MPAAFLSEPATASLGDGLNSSLVSSSFPVNSWQTEQEFYYWKRSGNIVGKPW